MHNIVKSTYSWRYVAERTERVYNFAMNQPVMNTFNRIKCCYTFGPFAGLLAVFYQIMEMMMFFIIELWWPASDIDIRRNFNTQAYLKNPHKHGDHEVKFSATSSFDSMNNATSNKIQQ